MIDKLNQYFEPRKDYGSVFLRIIIGWRLIEGTYDNVLSWDRMLEFRDFLALHGVPFPLLAANISVYAVFLRHPVLHRVVGAPCSHHFDHQFYGGPPDRTHR